MNASLRPFEPGRSLQSQLTARRLNDLQRYIPRIKFCGGGSRVSRLGDQVFVQIPRQIPAAPAPSLSFPFQVTMRVNPSNPALYQAMVASGTLMLSGRPNDNLSITGLNSWFSFIPNDVIALYIVVSGGVATSATIQSYGAGTTTFDPTLAAWDPSDNSYVFNDGGSPPQQIGINILIAYSTPKGDGSPYLVQAQFNHLLLENCEIDNFPAIFDFSHRQRYGITAP